MTAGKYQQGHWTTFLPSKWSQCSTLLFGNKILQVCQKCNGDINGRLVESYPLNANMQLDFDIFIGFYRFKWAKQNWLLTFSRCQKCQSSCCQEEPKRCMKKIGWAGESHVRERSTDVVKICLPAAQCNVATSHSVENISCMQRQQSHSWNVCMPDRLEQFTRKIN